MKGHKKVLYVVNIPSPYMVTFFNMLSEYVDLTVIFEKAYDQSRPLSWRTLDLNGFKHHVLKGISYTHEQIIPLNYKKYIKKQYDAIFIQSFFTPTGILMARILQKKKRPYTIVSEGGYIKNKRGLKEKMKYHVIKHASSYVSSSKETDLFLKHYGANEVSIVRYPFTSLHQHQILKKPLAKEAKLALRNKYKLPHDTLIILSVGRLSKEKNHQYVIDNLNHVNKPYLFILVGDGSEQEILKTLESIHHLYIKDLDSKTLFEYYQLADLFVLASTSEPWGLVVNEAMSQGCVVATSQYVNASKELIHQKNGFIFNIHEPYALAHLVNQIEDDSLEDMRIQSLYTIQKYSFEHMVEVFKKVIEV
jgi:glycosyltransferase involved in cell wall biosynthesis